MHIKRILYLLILIIFMAPLTSAQTQSGELEINTDPDGVFVSLKGEVLLTGISPVIFKQPLVGYYKLTLKKQGYETYQTGLNLNPTKSQTFDISLTPKTRFKSLSRSILIPGWGQRYNDQKFKGYLYTILAVASASAYLIADNKFDDKYDEFIKLEQQYDSLAINGNIDQLRALHPYLVEAQKEAHDAESIKMITIAAAFGVWAINVLDALLFFPENKSSFTVKNLTFKPSADLKNVSAKLTYSF